MKDLETLIPFVTSGQKLAIDAYLKFGSVADAAAHLGITPARLRAHLSEARSRAARAGWAPEHDMTKPVPDGFHVKGVSSYYDKDGKLKGQWIKSNKDQEHLLAALLDAIQEIAEPLRARSDNSLRGAPQHESEADTLSAYVIGDPHSGMFSWPEETGEAFDLKIAESTFLDAIEKLIAVSPPSEVAAIVNLGDMFHTDSSDNRTRRSGNPLDVDSRWTKIFQVGVRAHKLAIELALKKHKEVHVKIVPGNHDDHSALVLAICLKEYYSNNERVIIDTSPGKFQYIRFGENLIGITHGDSVKAQDLPSIMANDKRKDWGETDFHFWYTGHVHHLSVKEYIGCTVETFRTLAPGDAWHNAAGYRAGREMVCDVVHKDYGRVCRHTVGIKQIKKS